MKNVNYTGEEMYNITVIIITDKHKALIVRAAAHFLVYSLYLSIASQYIPFNAKKKKKFDAAKVYGTASHSVQQSYQGIPDI